jgi:hypothetical protein
LAPALNAPTSYFRLMYFSISESLSDESVDVGGGFFCSLGL